MMSGPVLLASRLLLRRGSVGFFFLFGVGGRSGIGAALGICMEKPPRTGFGVWGGEGKVGAKPGAQREELETHKSSAGGSGAEPLPPCPGGLRESGSQGTGGPVPVPVPRLSGALGARLNCENRDFLPAKREGSLSPPKPRPARNGPATGGDTQETPRGQPGDNQGTPWPCFQCSCSPRRA